MDAAPNPMSAARSDAGVRLVLGGSGFLGAWVTAALVARGRATATMAAPSGPPVVRAARRPADGPSFAQPRDAAVDVACDLEEPGAVEALLDELEPALVVGCAALARAALCAADPERARRLNADVPERVARWCAARGVRLVHVSTDLVFDGHPPAGRRFRETDPTGPLDVYGETKLAGERAVLAADPRALVARLPLCYGNSGGRGLGASDALLEAVERDAQPPLFSDEHRTPLEVSNAAEALAELALGDARGLLHVAGPDRVSRLELGLLVLAEMGLAPDAARAAVRASTRVEAGLDRARPADVSLDAARARALLATPLLGVREGLRRALG